MTFDPVECAKCNRGKHIPEGEMAGHPFLVWVCCKDNLSTEGLDRQIVDQAPNVSIEPEATRADPRQFELLF